MITLNAEQRGEITKHYETQLVTAKTPLEVRNILNAFESSLRAGKVQPEREKDSVLVAHYSTKLAAATNPVEIQRVARDFEAAVEAGRIV
jgi:hypothetical protein